MASEAKIVRTNEPTQVETEEKALLLDSTREQEIRIRAYEIYLQRGGQPGADVNDWLQAERELTAGTPFTTK